jgi:undecaprenyl-diphosphatase
VTAVAITIGAIWPRARAFVWLYALLVMSARVILNVNHPSDVIAGALVGIVGVLMVRRWFAGRRLVFFARDARVLPGPSWLRIRSTARRIIAETPKRAA